MNGKYVIITRRGSCKTVILNSDSICANCSAKNICEESDQKFEDRKGFIYIRIGCKKDIWDKYHKKEET